MYVLDSAVKVVLVSGIIYVLVSVVMYVLARVIKTIYAPKIYTSPCITFWMRAYTLLGQVGVGWALREFFGPCEMASSR
jgi:hypothetical protein